MTNHNKEEDTPEVLDSACLGYLGNQEYLTILLDEFFSQIKNIIFSWRDGQSSQEVAQLEIEGEIKRLSAIITGLDPDYKPVENWTGVPLAKWLKENAEIEFQQIDEGQSSSSIDITNLDSAEHIIRAYVTTLVSMYVGALAAEESGKMDPDRWRDWLEALKRKMRFQLLGIPG